MSKTFIPKAVRQAIAEAAKHRCGYCQTHTLVTGIAMQIDHIIPEAKGGSSGEASLWLACCWCNSRKSDQTHALDLATNQYVALFNPRQQNWNTHFAWSEDGVYVLGKTAVGRATVDALQMNNHRIVKSRFLWVAAGWHPPADV